MMLLLILKVFNFNITMNALIMTISSDSDDEHVEAELWASKCTLNGNEGGNDESVVHSDKSAGD